MAKPKKIGPARCLTIERSPSNTLNTQADCNAAEIPNQVAGAIDLDEAERFLKLLDPQATDFTFQTFDDNADRDDKSLLRILHGSLDHHAATLKRLNARGAGIFITVNQTDGKGRKATNIIRVRAVFADLDGAPLAPVLAIKSKPHIVVESSPERWHIYWLVAGMALEDFSATQKAIIARFNSDTNVHDLPRVMRLPGFFHRKSEPFLVRISSSHDAPAYPASHFRKAGVERRKSCDEQREPDPNKIKAALAVTPADDYGIWYRVGAALYFELGEDGFELFDAWSKTSAKYNPHKVKRKWADCRKVIGVKAGTIYWFADQAAPGWREAMLAAALASIRNEYATAVAAAPLSEGGRDA